MIFPPPGLRCSTARRSASLTCRSCLRSRNADLQALAGAGNGDVPLVESYVSGEQELLRAPQRRCPGGAEKQGALGAARMAALTVTTGRTDLARSRPTSARESAARQVGYSPLPEGTRLHSEAIRRREGALGRGAGWCSGAVSGPVIRALERADGTAIPPRGLDFGMTAPRCRRNRSMSFATDAASLCA